MKHRVPTLAVLLLMVACSEGPIEPVPFDVAPGWI